MFFTNPLAAAVAGLIIAFAYRKRADIGPAASNLALAAGIAMLVNSVLLATAISLLEDMATDWVSRGQEVPLTWRIAQNTLTPFSAVLEITVVGLMAMAVFAPRPVARAAELIATGADKR